MNIAILNLYLCINRYLITNADANWLGSCASTDHESFSCDIWRGLNDLAILCSSVQYAWRPLAKVDETEMRNVSRQTETVVRTVPTHVRIRYTLYTHTRTIHTHHAQNAHIHTRARTHTPHSQIHIYTRVHTHTRTHTHTHTHKLRHMCLNTCRHV